MGWALRLFSVNAAGIFIMYGAIELFYYDKRVQVQRQVPVREPI